MFNILDIKKMVGPVSDPKMDLLMKEILGSSKAIPRSMPGAKQLEKAQNIIVKDGIDSSVYHDKPYLLTTQNQRYLDQTLPENAQSAFIITGSGDTVFELVSRDVSRIVTVDTNDLQSLIMRLKRATIQTLKPTQYESFLVDPRDHHFMSKDVYKVVKDGFIKKEDQVAINFWDYLFEINPQEDLKQYLFKGIGGDPTKTKNALPYLKNKPAYYELRKKLETATIETHDMDAIEYFVNHRNEYFDYIDITNILLFVYQFQCQNDDHKYKRVLRALPTIYNNNLNNGGAMVIDYLFGVGLDDLENFDKADPMYRKVYDIYELTYSYLRELLWLEEARVSKLIDGFGPKEDTIIYTKK